MSLDRTWPGPAALLALACALAACAGTAVTCRARAEALQTIVTERELQLRSDEAMLAELPRLRREAPELAARFRHAFRADPEAAFLRDLAPVLRRDQVELATGSAGSAPESGAGGYHSAFGSEQIALDLHGSYRGVVATIEALSRGSQLVRVAAPSLRRAGDGVTASVPVTLYEPGAAHQ